MTEKITLKNITNAKVTLEKVFTRNLFTPTTEKDVWAYTTDLGQLALSISYTISENELILDTWMLNDEMKILLDKIINEIKDI